MALFEANYRTDEKSVLPISYGESTGFFDERVKPSLLSGNGFQKVNNNSWSSSYRPDGTKKINLSFMQIQSYVPTFSTRGGNPRGFVLVGLPEHTYPVTVSFLLGYSKNTNRPRSAKINITKIYKDGTKSNSTEYDMTITAGYNSGTLTFSVDINDEDCMALYCTFLIKTSTTGTFNVQQYFNNLSVSEIF